MKRLLSIFAIMLLIWSCNAPKSTISGIENVSFIEIYGTAKNYENMVEVIIDDKSPFKATVNQKDKNTTKISNYQITPGKHTIRVTYNGVELYNSQIFLTSQITKKIIIP